MGFPEEGAADGAGGAADVLTDWAQLHEAQQKVQEADNERIANEDRLSTTRVGDMTDEDLGHELVLFSAFVSKFVGRREN